jgi:predicted transcriptional regulator of viral defense system
VRDRSGAQDDVGRLTAITPPFHVQPPLDVALAGLAAAQHGVVTLDQLRGLGLSDRATRDRAAAGRLHRIHRAVYAVVPCELLTGDGRWTAAVFACGPEAVLSHRSAAALLELRRSERSKIDVTIPGRSPRKHSGIDVHRSTTFEHDRRQDQRLTVAGWTVIRTTWRHVTQRPEQVAATVVALLRR